MNSCVVMIIWCWVHFFYALLDSFIINLFFVFILPYLNQNLITTLNKYHLIHVLHVILNSANKIEEQTYDKL